MRKLILTSLAALLAATTCGQTQATEIAGAIGATSQGGMTYRLSLSENWRKEWFRTTTGRLTGYWDAGYTYWAAGDKGSAGHSVAFSPVFAYEFSTKNENITPFIEAGIGVAVFSSTHVGEQDLGSSFNFEDRIGFGVKLPDHQRVGIRATHYSNAGISEPNDGIESYALYYSHGF
jgi:lipid A 3-O-deacylase